MNFKDGDENYFETVGTQNEVNAGRNSRLMN